ncbi:beta strand repeat-containing protein, partial [Geobacter grbiciae]|uniref:beta strand repeat-containing protein n=1 Tax=Geobacter grbiciae TaxID=155042 RepID=UPI001C034D94
MDIARKIKWVFVTLCLLLVTALTSSAYAADWNLASGNSTVTINDSAMPGTSPGVYSWLLDNVERISQQAFYYRIGTTSPEVSVSGDALDATAPFTVAASNQTASSVTLTFTEKAGRFSIAVTYELIGGTTGRSTLNKKVVVTNLTAAPLDLHLFSYSDYDLKTGAYNFENASIVNGKAYQSSFTNTTDTVGNGATFVERATVPPSRVGIDNAQFLGSLANGATPYNLDNFSGPFPSNGDSQFAFQWDLTVDPKTPTSFTITDDFYPTKALYLSKASTPSTCVNYGQTFTNTYAFDNTRNLATPADNTLIREKLARDISLSLATDGGAYNATTGSVDWKILQMAAGAAQQTVQGTYTVNSAADFTMTSQIVSDETFPTSVSAKLTLCNHPPAITSFPSKNGTEGQAYSYQVTAVDSDPGTTLRYSLDVAPTGMTINSTSGLITWTPTSAQTGNNTITVRVSDSGVPSLWATQSYTLFIAYVNGAPSITSSPVTSAYVGVSYPYTVVATDPNLSQGDKLTFGLQTAPSGMTINPTTGVISWTPDATQVGPQNVVVQVTDNGYLFAQQSFTVTVSATTKQTPVITWTAPAAITYGTALGVTQLNATANVPGTYVYTPASGAVLNAGSQTLSVTFTPTDTTTYTTATATTTLTVNKATPTITWATPASVPVGTALSSTQLNATASTAGSFAYTPVSGTVLTTAGAQTLSATFTPTDTTNYNGASASVNLSVVAKQVPAITWAAPAAITYGTALSAAQLNATAGVPGTYTYTPAGGTVLNAGTQPLSVTFTPTDTTTYTPATATVSLTVNKASQTVSFTSTTPASPAIGGTYTPAATATSGLAVAITLDAASTGCTLASGVVTFTGAGTCVIDANQAGTTNYNAAAQVQQSIGIVKGASTVTVTGATSFTYTGAPQGPGTATVTGSTGAVTYSYAGTGTTTYPASATKPTNAGSYTVTATVAADANYNGASSSATAFTITKASATVTLGNLTATYDGTAKAATATTIPNGLTISFTYAGGTTAPTAAGSYAVVATVNDANYTGGATGTLTIAKASQTVSFTSTIPASPAIGGTYTPAATATSGLAAAITLDAASTGCTLASGVVTFTGAGTCVIDANQAGTTNYNAAAQVQQNIGIGKGASTVTVTGATSFTYTGTPQGPGTATVTGSTGAVTYSYAGTGTTTYPASATKPINAGSYTVTATVAADANYNGASSSATAFTINKASATVTLGNLTATYDGSAKAATATTNPNGLTISFTYAGGTTAPTAAGSYAVVATVNDANYTGSATGTLVIANATSTITWATPTAVPVGTALSSTQLNATANTAGTFTYTPATGTVMSTVGTQALSVSFTPTDSTNYTSATASVSLSVVAKQLPTITWAAPAAITYGTALDATQLNATANVAGTFVYTPASGTVLNAGSQTLLVTFTPTDTATYTTATKTVSLTVNKASATITLSGLSATYDGTTKAATATTSPAGVAVSLTYKSGKTTVTSPTAAGSYSVTATVNDANYTGSATGTLVIAKATSTITWATPTAVPVGTALSSTQLNATANTAGSFSYTPAAGTVMNT